MRGLQWAVPFAAQIPHIQRCKSSCVAPARGRKISFSSYTLSRIIVAQVPHHPACWRKHLNDPYLLHGGSATLDTPRAFCSTSIARSEPLRSGSQNAQYLLRYLLRNTNQRAEDAPPIEGSFQGLPGILARNVRHRRRSRNLYANFWRIVPIPNPFDLSASYNYDIYTDALQSYRQAVRSPKPQRSVIPHVMTALELGRNHLSPAEQSRIAACAVRLAIYNGRFEDALAIVDALSRTHKWTQNPVHVPSGRPSGLLNFGEHVSPKLAYHSLIHTLIRRGQPVVAGRNVRIMAARDIPVRGVTLTTLVRVLCKYPWARIDKPAEDVSSENAIVDPSVKAQDLAIDFSVVKSAVQQSLYAGIPHAYAVLHCALTLGHDVGESYVMIIETCISRGELVIASLLYIGMLKHLHDYPRQDHIGEIQKLEDDDESDPPVLTKLIEQIRGVLRDDYGSSEYEAALQASINLLAAFENRRLRTGKLGPFFSMLSLCRNSHHEVWVYRNLRFTRVSAFPYIQSSFLWFVQSLLESSEPSWQLAPDRRSYNALIAHALECLHCPFLAVQLVEHMVLHRQPIPFFPDEETQEILNRNSAFLYRGHFSADTLDTLLWDVSRIHDGPIYVNHPWDECEPLDNTVEERYHREYRRTLDDYGHAESTEDPPAHVAAGDYLKAGLADEPELEGDAFRNFLRQTRDRALSEAARAVERTGLRSHASKR